VIRLSPRNFLVVTAFAILGIALARMGAVRFGISGLTELIG
jgi:hypothetical protein